MAHGAPGPVPPPGYERNLWYLSTFAAGLSLIASYIAFWRTLGGSDGGRVIEALYSSIELLLLHVPYSELEKVDQTSLLLLHIARFLGVVFTAAAVAALLWRFFGNEYRVWHRGRIGRHTVLCGFGPVAKQLAREFSEDNVVIIDDHADNAAVLEIDPRAALLEANPASPLALNGSKAWNAARLFAATDADGANVGIAVQAAKLAKEKGSRPHILVHITDPQLRVSLRHNAAFKSEDGKPRVSIFNVFENSARLLFLRPNHELDRLPIQENDERVVQLIVIGFGHMGEALITRAAMVAHCANLKPPLIVVVDRHAKKKELLFRARYPQLDSVVKAEFIESDAGEAATQKHIADLCADPSKTVTTVVISCDDSGGLALALSLDGRLREDVPVRLRLNDHSGLIDLPRPPRITVFGSMHDACSREHWVNQELDRMARAMHEDHRHRVHEAGKDSPDDRTLRAWEQLDDDLIDSNRQAADHIWVKLRAAGCRGGKLGKAEPGAPFTGFTEGEIELLAKMEHQRWMAERYLAGWVYGPEKHPSKLISPYLVPWDKVPGRVKEYDRDFVKILPRVLKLGGWEILR